MCGGKTGDFAGAGRNKHPFAFVKRRARSQDVVDKQYMSALNHMCGFRRNFKGIAEIHQSVGAILTFLLGSRLCFLQRVERCADIRIYLHDRLCEPPALVEASGADAFF